MRKQLYVGLAVILILMSFCHPMHVSVTEIEIDSEEKALKVITHIFMDDIEKNYRMVKGDNELDITADNVKTDFEQFLGDYLSKNLDISVNGNQIEVVYLGYEEEGDGLWCYMEAEKIKKVKTLEVKNTILLETFEDQTNIVHLEFEKKIKSTKLDSKTTEHLFKIEQ